jgi:hypothetical protein
MASAASEQHAARDFHAICSTSATILTEAICAINALSLHLHGALGPGFDPEQVLDCAGVEDILTAPMKRRLILRRSLSLSSVLNDTACLTLSAVAMGHHLRAWIFVAAAQVPLTLCFVFGRGIVRICLSQCALPHTITQSRSSY